MNISNITFIYIIIVTLFLFIFIFLILRSVSLWYWQIDKRVELMEEQNKLLRKLVDKICIKSNDTNLRQSIKDKDDLDE